MHFAAAAATSFLSCACVFLVLCCPCSYGPCEAEALKDRMLRAVASLGAAEVRSIVEEQGHVEVTCELCNEQFQFSEADVMQYV